LVAVVDLDEMVLRVHPGNGIVARFGGVVLAVAAPDARQDPLVDEILRVVEACAGQGSPPGRSLSRRLAGLISQAEPDEVPSFAALAQVEGGLAVLMHGSIEAILSGPEGAERLSGRQAASWVDRIIDTQVDSVVVSDGEVAVATDTRTSLREGVVTGGGLSLVAAGAPDVVPEVAPPEVAPPEVAPPEVAVPEETPAAALEVAEAGGTATEARSTASPAPDVSELDGATDDPFLEDVDVAGDPPDVPRWAAEPEDLATALAPDGGEDPMESGRTTVSPQAAADEAEPEPEPELEGEPEAAEAADASEEGDEATGPVIKGVICARGHFGDPSAAYCAVCGTSMDHRTLHLVDGNRPSLGSLVFDDGTTADVDGDYVLGREPERDEAVVAGRARPLLVSDDDLEISRIHAGVVLDGWDATIVDLGSANGTFISTPAETSWTRLIPHVPVVLSGGTRVRLGQRTILFDSPTSP
jgi:hypothetical protein